MEKRKIQAQSSVRLQHVESWRDKEEPAKETRKDIQWSRKKTERVGPCGSQRKCFMKERVVSHVKSSNHKEE